MERFFKTIFPFIILLTSAQIVYSQSMSELDKHLATLLEKVDYWESYNGDNREDSLEKVNSDLSAYLKEISLKYPQTITTQLPNAKKSGLTVVTSDDHKLRFYSWDTRMGGTMRNYSDQVQYQTDKGIRFNCMNCDTVEIDYGCYYTGITTIHTKNNKTLYFVNSGAVASTSERAESIDSYIIDGDSLKKAKVFKTKTQTLSSIGYGIDIFSSSAGNKDIPHIHFGQNNKRLYIPIVEGEKVTSRYLVYVFDGNNFVFDKNAK